MYGLDWALKDSFGVCKTTGAQRLLCCPLQDANVEQLYPMCLLSASKMLAKGGPFFLSLQSSSTQLLWKWLRASQTDRQHELPNMQRAQPLGIPGCKNGPCHQPGMLILA